jgi:dihydroorotate dehydrogenase electron transfer subunit
MQPVHVVGELISRRRVGAYHLLTVAAPGVAERARPGQFVAVAVGGRGSGMLLRRCFAIHATTPQGACTGTAQFVVDVTGAGTAWLAELPEGERVDLVGPLGSPFLLADEPLRAVLVGGGHSSASLFPLADALHAQDCAVEFVLGARTADRLFGELAAKRTGAGVTVTTDDGSAGVAGTVVDVLPEVVGRSRANAIFAAGPTGMLRAVSEAARSFHVPCQVAVEEPMACGTGLCQTCVLPVVDDDGVTKMLRSCVDGPVFFASRVRWDDLRAVPADCLGARGVG